MANRVSACCGAEIHKHHFIQCDEWGKECVCGRKKNLDQPICEECWQFCVPVDSEERFWDATANRSTEKRSKIQQT